MLVYFFIVEMVELIKKIKIIDDLFGGMVIM